MGLLIEGEWHDKWYDTSKTGGAFKREPTKFHGWVTAGGEPGPNGEQGFPAQAGRYHLYVSLACPWAHRTLVFRRLKKLEDAISFDVVSPDMLDQGWEFEETVDGTSDRVNGKRYLRDIYTLAEPKYTGRVTVPVLWDRETGTIVNNESAEIIRMLNSSFDAFTDVRLDLYPPHLREEIDAVNDRVYHDVNNGVYRAGFATAQDKYEQAFDGLFETLDWIEERLARQRYLVGNTLTEADWRLFTTLVRFDAVYYSHFKCNLRRIVDYPNLSNYLRELYQFPRVSETVNFRHIKRHYYYSHGTINPTRIVPKGPAIDLEAAHDRDRFPRELAA